MLLISLSATPVFADYKITQKTIIDDFATEFTVYSKGVRERRESKMIMDGLDAEESAMMAKMMPPSPIKITQCDLKQTVSINDPKKYFFIDYDDWSSLPPDQLKRLPKQKIVIKGTTTVSSVVTDLGKRAQKFGFTAKWLKAVQSIDNSADSCEGQASVRIEREGWFVNLSLEGDYCEAPPIPPATGGCRPKLIMKTMHNPGFFLEGTTKMYENGKLQGTSKIETTALSKATLDQGLFEIPKGYKEMDSMAELMGAGEIKDTSATTTFSDTGKSVKTVAIDFFSGNTSKIDQDGLREYIAQKLSAAGLSGRLVSSQAELTGGNYANTIAVEIKKLKESGASKIGGLFGKVTGSSDMAKAGSSSAEIVVTLYGPDGRTVISSSPANAEVKGSPNDAVKAAIDQVISQILIKAK